MMRRCLTVFALALIPAAAAASACSATSGGNSGAGFGGDGGSGSGLSGSGGDPGVGPGSGGNGGGLMFDSGTDGSQHHCSQALTLVYVVSQQNALYSFDPGSLTFTEVGPLDCPAANGAQPFSMAVDREGFAWVLYSGGGIFKVDIKTAACTPSGYMPNQQGFHTFGMGFSTDGSSTNEKLYVADYQGTGIATIDTSSLMLTPIGQYDAIHSAAELTGTGDGRLFGFFEQDPIIIGEIDKTNSHVISQHPEPNITIGVAWAFAFWGGSFWLFTNPSGSGSQVDQYDPATGDTTTVIPDVGGFSIVGAGVSTCAPVKPPH